jgi:putative transposase
VFRTIFAQPEAAAVGTTWDHVRDQLRPRFTKIGPLMDDAQAEVLAFTTFPRLRWTMYWSNTRSDGSTGRSNDEPASSGTSPTNRRKSDWSVRS